MQTGWFPFLELTWKYFASVNVCCQSAQWQQFGRPLCSLLSRSLLLTDGSIQRMTAGQSRCYRRDDAETVALHRNIWQPRKKILQVQIMKGRMRFTSGFTATQPVFVSPVYEGTESTETWMIKKLVAPHLTPCGNYIKIDVINIKWNLQPWYRP